MLVPTSDNPERERILRENNMDIKSTETLEDMLASGKLTYEPDGKK